MRKDLALEKYFFSVLRNMRNNHLVKVKANAFSEAYSEPNQASQIEVLVKKAFSRLLFLTKISCLNVMRCAIWYYLYNLKNVKNTHGWVLRLKPATLLKLILLHGCFSRFLNWTNATKSRNAPQISDWALNAPLISDYFLHLFTLYFKLQSWTKYLRQTVVFIWNSALREKSNFCFSQILAIFFILEEGWRLGYNSIKF